eukprot:GFUD01077793.1.p1 GENE.GFUD01077793.1~~GFUD01077793.1.p1  ORF type:complete len:203 (-),score=48.07 GFUD01077793.1:76-684(-)
MSKVLTLIFSVILTQSTMCIKLEDFGLPNFPTIKLSKQSLVPRMIKFKKIEVVPINAYVKVNMKLVEFLFLNMDFNYLKMVPKPEKLTFRLPDIVTFGSKQTQPQQLLSVKKSNTSPPSLRHQHSLHGLHFSTRQSQRTSSSTTILSTTTSTTTFTTFTTSTTTSTTTSKTTSSRTTTFLTLGLRFGIGSGLGIGPGLGLGL